MMEFHSNKDAAVAIKIFDLGAKRFPNEVDYVIRHLQFLLSINDDTSEFWRVKWRERAGANGVRCQSVV
jgi:cleavage stimulation factor subunit 3